MAVTYKDIDELSQKSTVAGTEKLPVSDTQYITPNQIASLAGSGVVHTTGDETIAGDKTFSDDIVVGDASNIVYSGGGGGGFTKGTKSSTNGSAANTIAFSGLSGEPKAFVATINYFSLPGTSTAATLTVVGDSTVCHGVYTSGTQHNYSASFTKSYTNGTLTITAPTGVVFLGTYGLTYYYGDGTLTFRTSQVSPGSGVTSVTFTGTGLTEVPTMYACMLETQVSSASYRRVASYTNSFYDALDAEDVVSEGLTFYSNQISNTTSSFTVSYNNGLNFNSGGTNAGGYFHNPGTYTLYYLMASDIGGGGGGSYQNLADELADKQETLVSGTNIKTINNNSLLGSGDITISGGGAGTLNTTATTAQSTNASEALSGNVTLHKISKTGTYSDLIGTPTIPTVNNSTITVQMNGSTVDSFTTNASSNKTINLGGNFPKYVLCADEAAYTAITPKDSGTLYLIPES